MEKMKKVVVLFIALGIVCLTGFLRSRLYKASARSLIWKTMTSVCFLATAFYGIWLYIGKETGQMFPFLVTGGLFFGLLGDIWLDLKWNCPEEDGRYTYAGFCSFAVGHVFFLFALIGCCRGNADLLWILIPFILAVALGVMVGMGDKRLNLDYGRFRNITILYGILLISTTLISGSLLLYRGFRDTTLILFFAGAVLFLLSDLILSGTYFGKGKNRPVDIISNHVLYYAAQFLIALSVVVNS